MLKAYTSLFTSLNIPYEIVSASDPFFGEDPSIARGAQRVGGSKFEVRIPLPSGSLSVGSVNAHGTTFAEAFDLSALGVEATCCSGIGVERLTYALLSYDLIPDHRTHSNAIGSVHE